MSARTVLIVHPEEASRARLKALVGADETMVAASRLEALPLLEQRAPGVVITHHSLLKRLIRDLEQLAPGALVVTLCPVDDHELKRSLVGLASDGFEFITVDDRDEAAVRALAQPRSSMRHAAPAGLVATVAIDLSRISASLLELGSDGLSLLIDPSVSSDRFEPGRQIEVSLADVAGRVVMQPRLWTVRNVRRGTQPGVLVGCCWTSMAPPTRAPVVISNEVQVRTLLRRAGNRALRFDLATEAGTGRTSFLKGKPDLLDQCFELSAPMSLPKVHGEKVVRLSFELNGQLTEGLTRVLDASADRVVLARPQALVRWHRRESLRANVLHGLKATVDFKSPLSGSVLQHAVADLDPAGLGFTFDGEKEALPPGLMIDRLRLSILGQVISCSAVVENSAPAPDEPGLRLARRCGLRLCGLSGEDADRLREALIAILAPDVADGGQLPFEKIWDLIRATNNHFSDHPHDDPDSVVRLSDTHARLGPAHELARTFTLSDQHGQLMGHASGVRIYSRTWLSGHLMVRPGYHRQMQLSQQLTKLTFDYAEALSDVEFTRGFWRMENRWSARVFGGAGSRLLRPGLVSMAMYWPMRNRSDAALPAPRLLARRAEDDDLDTFLQYARGVMDPVRMRADDLSRDELSLRSVGSRFAERGLRRERVLGVVDGPAGPAGWVLVESSSPGLVWAEFYNASQLFVPPGPLADEARLALVHFAAERARFDGRKALEFLAAACDVSHLAQLGFLNPRGELRELTLHRQMTREAIFQILAAFEKVARRRPREEEEAPPDEEHAAISA